MTSTNRAFIDAYQATPRSQTARSQASGEPTLVVTPFVGTSEMVFASTTYDQTPEATPAEVALGTGTRATRVTHSVTTTPPAPHAWGHLNAAKSQRQAKRSLSALRAEAEGHAQLQQQIAQANQAAATSSPAIVTPIVEATGMETTGIEANWPTLCQKLLAESAEQYDALLRRLSAEASTGVMVGLVGAASGVGCTTTAICLAIRSAALGYSTLLMDANLSRPALAAQLGIETFQGWERLLQSNQSIESALLPAGEVEIDLLLAGPESVTQLDLSTRFRASITLGKLRRQYQRVIIDLGAPAADSSQAEHPSMLLAAALGIDHLLAVTSPESTNEQLDSTFSQLESYHLHAAGLIVAA